MGIFYNLPCFVNLGKLSKLKMDNLDWGWDFKKMYWPLVYWEGLYKYVWSAGLWEPELIFWAQTELKILTLWQKNKKEACQ